MAEPKTKRQFQERFLDGYDRSQLRQDIQKVNPKPLMGLRKKYATWALGASLVLGGIGAPMIQQSRGQTGADVADIGSGVPVDRTLAGDLKAASNIAEQVASGVVSGVESAVSAPVAVVAAAPQAAAEAAAQAPRSIALVSEKAKEQFFKSEVPFGSIIYKEAKKNNLRPELVAAVVQAESQFKPNARSGVGAVGLMQLMPRTGRWMGARDLTNPAQNIQAGVKYLKYLDERFDGNETKIIAAYNAGEGNVRKFGGVPPFKETKNYISKVRRYEGDFMQRVETHIADVSAAAQRAGG